jgi:hypothetical protein
MHLQRNMPSLSPLIVPKGPSCQILRMEQCRHAESAFSWMHLQLNMPSLSPLMVPKGPSCQILSMQMQQKETVSTRMRERW